MTSDSTLYDRPDSFGWISIVLHWVTAIAIIAMWFIGKSIATQHGDDLAARRTLHITLGLSVWILFLARIVWRICVGHPHAHGQSNRIHKVARFTHYLMLLALSVMMFSGPFMAWILPQHSLLAYKIHATSANLLFALVVIHTLGAMKHLMFHDDETMVRIFLPRPNSSSSNKQQDP